MDAVQDLVKRGMTAITKTKPFSEWLSAEDAKGEGLVGINNSFIYRDLVPTSKNEQYPCLRLKDGKIVDGSILIAKPSSFNTDFKLYTAGSKNMPQTQSLEAALQSEIKRLGQLVLVLIGQIEDVPCEVSIDHSYARTLRFDHASNELAAVTAPAEGGKCVVVNELIDPDAAWRKIEATIEGELGAKVESFRSAFAVAFEKLQREAESALRLPSAQDRKSGSSFLGRVRASVGDQRNLYQLALRKTLRVRTTRGSSFNEVLRIAYNFADDAIRVLTLLVSVCDLKGVILWCTLHQHFELAEAFRALPWTKIRGKPSLRQYQEVINGARNRAFHNLLAFDRTLKSDLTGLSIKARSLTLLPTYGRRKGHVSFDYEDRELVEVLSELTLAPETAVSMEFWNRNAQVMGRFEDLVGATEDALWALNEARA
jgi:hypothetical protein